MPKLRKAKNRDKKRKKARHGMKVNGKSLFIIQQEQIKRAEKIKKEKEEKNQDGK